MAWFGKKKSREDRVKKFSERMIAARDSDDEPAEKKEQPRVSDQFNIPDLSDDLDLADDVDLSNIDPQSDLAETALPDSPGGDDGRSAADILKQLNSPQQAATGPAIDPLGIGDVIDDDLVIDTPDDKTGSRDHIAEVDLELEDDIELDDLDDIDISVNLTPKTAPVPPAAPVSAPGKEMSDNQTRIGRLLLAEGPFTRDALRSELESAGRLASPIAQVLLNTGAPEESALFVLLLKNYRIPKVRLDGFRIPQQLRTVIPPDLVQRFRMIPIDLVGDILCIAVENLYTLPSKALLELRERTGYRVKVFAGDAANVSRLLGSPAAGRVLKPRKVRLDDLGGLAPISPEPGHSAAAFRYGYCGPGTLMPVPAKP
ncbi:MAG: hypothetical protein E3J72_10905 [Planctomycetota bacterium]|nr:MAG: hypothetical protein E3J72_10905 [Planctomycetota bacterium]